MMMVLKGVDTLEFINITFFLFFKVKLSDAGVNVGM